MHERKNQFFEVLKSIVYVYVIILLVFASEVDSIDILILPRALFGMFYFAVVPFLSLGLTWQTTLLFVPLFFLVMVVNRKTKYRLTQFTVAAFLSGWIYYGRYCMQFLVE